MTSYGIAIALPLSVLFLLVTLLLGSHCDQVSVCLAWQQLAVPIKGRITNLEKKPEQDLKGPLPTYSTMWWLRVFALRILIVRVSGFGLLVMGLAS